jgi:hypothetical protein
MMAEMFDLWVRFQSLIDEGQMVLETVEEARLVRSRTDDLLKRRMSGGDLLGRGEVDAFERQANVVRPAIDAFYADVLQYLTTSTLGGR